MSDYDRAMQAYEAAIRHNTYSIPALSSIAALCRHREQFPRAVEYFQRILSIDQNNGEIWGALGHCYLMMDDLQKAYSAYQQALYYLPSPKEPKLWYGIGILYDRYGSLEHAEEAFSQVMRMEPKFEKANEIYFRLGIIYKQQQKYESSLGCFKYILHNPPRPLTEVDIWFQIGHVYDMQKNYTAAKDAYERVLVESPNHAKVLQQLGWLYHQPGSGFTDQEHAITYLTKSISSDDTDPQSWYLLGRCFMAQQKYNKAYEAYQQAVYRDSQNPTFWCSIGVLYYQISQFRDALDAYSRAIRLNPSISEVWYDLGTLYEACNNQISDALDAYQRAADLEPSNPHIKLRLQMLRNQQAQGGQTTAPVPQDVINPQAYQSQNGASMIGNPQYTQPPGPQGPPPLLQNYGNRSVDSRPPHQQPPPLNMNFPPISQNSGRDLPPINRSRSPVPPYNLASHHPPHIRDSTTSPNQPPSFNPVMQPPHDAMQLPPQSAPPPLRHNNEKRPSPQLPHIPEDRRSSRYSPQLPESQPSTRQYNPSPRMGPEHSASQHNSYHPHQSMPLHSQPVVDRRDTQEMYDPTKVKPEESSVRHGNGVQQSSHQPSYHTSDTHPTSPPSPSPSLAPSVHESHQSHHPHHDYHHRLHENESPVEDKSVLPVHYRQEEHHLRRRSPPHMPELKPPLAQSELSSPPPQRPSVTRESPVRENAGSSYGISNGDNNSPVSASELPRKSSSPEPQPSRMSSGDASRELPKPNILNDESSSAPHSPNEPRSPSLARIVDNPIQTDAEANQKPVLPAIRTTLPPITSPQSDRSVSRQVEVDDDYDGGSAADTLLTMRDTAAPLSSASSASSGGQKRPYSPKADAEEDRAREENSAKRSRTSPTTRANNDDGGSPTKVRMLATRIHRKNMEMHCVRHLRGTADAAIDLGRHSTYSMAVTDNEHGNSPRTSEFFLLEYVDPIKAALSDHDYTK
ncbi:9391_t:CDS:10 [Paraglomus occultum]|uniref:9391_t:CDS:1 n=1 Tax=Paraglomus occultum TaxID=144539 RepID=A0A9N9A5A6_9GLOM|nr:9391_t:CDS:10 [Paraglomus occultum]